LTIFALELDTRFKIKFLYEFYFIKMTLTLIELRKKMDYLDLKKAQKSYLEGQNIMEFLRKEFKESGNTSRIIEIAYELQSGSYINFANSNKNIIDKYVNELSTFIAPYLDDNSSLLDVGAGELTTLSLLLNKLKKNNLDIFAFDISWSRLFKGREFFNENCVNKKINIFVANMKQIPLGSKSIDVVISNHSLEPNRTDLRFLLKEIFRIAKYKCVFFEPSYELNSKDGKKRMDNLGYIKDIEVNVRALGGKVLDVSLIKNVINPVNPTACYVIEPPQKVTEVNSNKPKFTAPGTDFYLEKDGHFFSSPDTGLFFPILKEIPVIKSDLGIFGSSFFDK